MKAIHNICSDVVFYFIVENYGLKYNFESNSQLNIGEVDFAGGWELWSKIQFWKQFTTDYIQLMSGESLRIMV